MDVLSVFSEIPLPVDMERLHTLLDLIAKGDHLGILSEEKLTDGLNSLLKNELISFEDGKVNLTEKGKNAHRQGLSFVFQIEEVDLNPKEFSDVSRKRSKRNFIISLFVLFITLLILTWFIFFDYSVI